MRESVGRRQNKNPGESIIGVFSFLKACILLKKFLLFAVMILENFSDRFSKSGRDLERQFQRWRIPSGLDCDDRLPCHTNLIRQMLLRHFAGIESQSPDVVVNC